MTDTSVAETERANPSEVRETEMETKAREMGWKPEDEWDGEESRWMPADEFLERNERLKDRGDGILKADNARLTGEVSELRRTLEDLKGHMTKVEKNAYDRAIREVQAKQRAAVAEGDVEAFEEAEKERADLDKEVRAHAESGKQDNPDTDPAFVDWSKDNGWYNDDVAMTVWANQAAPIIARRTGLTPSNGRAYYDAITEAVKEQFPDKFGNARRKAPPTVEGAGDGRAAGKTLWDQVPKDARETFKRFVRQGLYEDTKEGREKYADAYLNG